MREMPSRSSSTRLFRSIIGVPAIKNQVATAKKLIRIAGVASPLWIWALRYGVAASIEHEPVLRSLDCRSVIDIGANRGQFALAARYYFPSATIISFEPLAQPAALFQKIFASDDSIVLHVVAVGPTSEKRKMHVSGRDDSSSLLPISSLQDEIFPGTREVSTIDVQVAPLDALVEKNDIVSPAMLKLDVQGFELDALRGCESLLHKFDWVYCECSFVELYSGQKLAGDVIIWLLNRGFRLMGMYNPSYDRNGQSIQADFLFCCIN